jgi:hypothetical protein
MGARAAASGVGGRELAAVELEPEPVSGACLRHAPSTRQKTKHTATAPIDCHRLLGAAAAHESVGGGVWVFEAGPRVIR